MIPATVSAPAAAAAAAADVPTIAALDAWRRRLVAEANMRLAQLPAARRSQAAFAILPGLSPEAASGAVA